MATPFDTSFDNPQNWSMGYVPVAGDDVVFGTPPDIETFGGGGGGGLVNCDGMHAPAGGGVYNSVTLRPDYGATVTLSSGFTTGALVLEGGAISQPSAGTDITVAGGYSGIFPAAFTWTGGTLNSSSYTSTVYIRGDGNIAPANDGTITTGSTLEFVGTEQVPTTTTVHPGTIQFDNAAGAVVGAFATLKARTFTEGDIIGLTVHQAGATSIQIQSNGTLWIIGPGTYNSNLRVINSGLFKITGSALATLTGGNATQFDYVQGAVDSKLHIENGSTLDVPHGMEMTNGSVYLLMNPNLPASQQNATIYGTFNMGGGAIVFAPPIPIGTAVVYGTFTVNGNVNWTGGTYRPNIDYANPGLASKWIVLGTMSTAATAILDPNTPPGQNPPANNNWEVMEALATAGNLPTVPAASPLRLAVVPGTPTRWRLLS
jgi:hypothetical protein